MKNPSYHCYSCSAKGDVISFFYLLLIALILHRCAQAFPSCSKRGLFLVAVHELVLVMVSLVAEHRLLVPQPRIELTPSALKEQSLTH